MRIYVSYDQTGFGSIGNSWSMFRIDVTTLESPGDYWCLEELSFWDENGDRMTVSFGGGSAESQYSSTYAAGMAFNEESNNDHSYYCSQNGYTSASGTYGGGWLQYTFDAPVVVASYQIEDLNGWTVNYAPLAWTMSVSNDGVSWTVVDTQTNVVWGSDGVVAEFPIAEVGMFST